MGKHQIIKTNKVKGINQSVSPTRLIRDIETSRTIRAKVTVSDLQLRAVASDFNEILPHRFVIVQTLSQDPPRTLKLRSKLIVQSDLTVSPPINDSMDVRQQHPLMPAYLSDIDAKPAEESFLVRSITGKPRA